MNIKTYLSLTLTLFLFGCGGGAGVTTSETVQQKREPGPVNILGPGEAYLVHVNQRERIVTVTNARQLEEGYYIAIDEESAETAALELMPPRPAGLRTAEILEGAPSINDRIRRASPSRAAELAETAPASTEPDK